MREPCKDRIGNGKEIGSSPMVLDSTFFSLFNKRRFSKAAKTHIAPTIAKGDTVFDGYHCFPNQFASTRLLTKNG